MDDKLALMQNLTDAGCDASLTQRLLSLLEGGQTKEGLVLLARHRRVLLEHCHTEEKKISCLDYLVHQLKQNGQDKEKSG